MARFALLLISALLLLAACSQPPEHLGIASVTPTETENVPLDTVPSVTFTDAVDADTLSTASVVVLVDDVQYDDFEPELSTDGRTVTLPIAPLAGSATYTIVVERTVATASGRTLDQARDFSFTTVPDPADINDGGDGGDDGNDGGDGSDDGNDGTGDDGTGDDGTGDDGTGDDGTGDDDGGAGNEPAVPTVVSTLPERDAEGVRGDAAIVMVFDMDMNADSLAAEGALELARLLDAGERAELSGDVTYEASERRATFVPAARLAYGATYEVTVSGSVASAGEDGQPMGTDYVWTFTTAPLDVAPAPTADPVVVANGGAEYTVTLVFDKPLDPLSLTNDSVKVTSRNMTSQVSCNPEDCTVVTVVLHGSPASGNPKLKVSEGAALLLGMDGHHVPYMEWDLSF